jgi:hypothetical protein
MDYLILEKLVNYYAKKQRRMLWTLEMIIEFLTNLQNPRNQNLLLHDQFSIAQAFPQDAF